MVHRVWFKRWSRQTIKCVELGPRQKSGRSPHWVDIDHFRESWKQFSSKTGSILWIETSTDPYTLNFYWNKLMVCDTGRFSVRCVEFGHSRLPTSGIFAHSQFWLFSDRAQSYSLCFTSTTIQYQILSHRSKNEYKKEICHQCLKEMSSDKLQTNWQVATFAADNNIQVMILAVKITAEKICLVVNNFGCLPFEWVDTCEPCTCTTVHVYNYKSDQHIFDYFSIVNLTTSPIQFDYQLQFGTDLPTLLSIKK